MINESINLQPTLGQCYDPEKTREKKKICNKGKAWPGKEKVRIRYSFLGYSFLSKSFTYIAFY